MQANSGSDVSTLVILCSANRKVLLPAVLLLAEAYSYLIARWTGSSVNPLRDGQASSDAGTVESLEMKKYNLESGVGKGLALTQQYATVV